MDRQQILQEICVYVGIHMSVIHNLLGACENTHEDSFLHIVGSIANILYINYYFSAFTLRGLVLTTCWYGWTRIGIDVLNMAWDVVSQDRLRINDLSDIPCTKSCCISDVQRFYNLLLCTLCDPS